MAEHGAQQLQVVALTLAALVAFPVSVSASAKLKSGDKAPKFRLRTLDGTMVRLDELAYTGREKRYAKKRPVLLDFFRTDCAPCRKSMPDLVKLHKEFSKRGLEVVLVALLEREEGREKLERYLKSQRLPFTVVVDSTEYVAERYLGNPVTLPATFLLDRNGKLKKVKYGAGNLRAEFESPMKEALKAHQEAL